jgi:copper ion binding protein
MGLFGTKNHIKLDVEGMTCDHCVARVTKALEDVDDVKTVKVDLSSNSADVTLKSDNVELEKLVNAVKEAGYKAKVK